jgi:hypothetical protein
MSRTARWIVVTVVVLAAAFAGARAARRFETTRPVVDEPRAVDVATTTTNAAPPKRRHAETTEEAPESTQSSSDDEKPAPSLVRFRVQTKDGKPITGAKIEVKTDDAPQVELVTDEAGRARLPTATAARELNFVVKARGYVAEERCERTDDEAVVTLRPGVDVAGRVVDGPSGRPIAGASLSAFESGTQSDPLIAEATSNADGAFVLADVLAENTWIDVHAAAHVGAGFEFEPTDPGPLLVRLDPAGRVRGVVRDADGSPVWDVQVSATTTQGVQGDTCPFGATDMEGRFALDGLRLDSEYVVRARVGDRSATAKVIVNAATPEARLDLVPRTPTSLTVVVTSVGEPPRRACVLVCRDDAFDGLERGVDTAKSAVFEGLDPGPAHVYAWADDHAVETLDVDLVEGEAKRVEISLDRDLVVEGTIVDDAGDPVAGARVLSEERIGRARKQTRTADAGADGRFSLHLLTPGNHELMAMARSNGRGFARVVAAWEGAPPVRVVLPRTTTARLRVRPIGSSEQIRLLCEWFDEAGVCVDTTHVIHTPDDLDVTIDAPSSARQLRIRVDGFVPICRDVRPVVGKPLDLGEIVLDVGVDLVVRAVDADGRAVAPQQVDVTTSDGAQLADGFPRDDGTFEAHGFAPGKIVVVVYAAGFLDAKVPVEATKSGPPVVVKLARGAYARVRVVDADNRAAACDGVKAFAVDETETKLEPKMSGVFVARLPAGRVRFVATRGDVEIESTVELVEGGTTDVTLQFAR